jgi:hypothetical protein
LSCFSASCAGDDPLLDVEELEADALDADELAPDELDVEALAAAAAVSLASSDAAVEAGEAELVDVAAFEGVVARAVAYADDSDVGEMLTMWNPSERGLQRGSDARFAWRP